MGIFEWMKGVDVVGIARDPEKLERLLGNGRTIARNLIVTGEALAAAGKALENTLSAVEGLASLVREDGK